MKKKTLQSRKSLRITAALIGALAIPYSMAAVYYQNGFETSENYTTTGGSGNDGRIAGQGGNGSNLSNWVATNGNDSHIVTSSSGTTTLSPAQGNQMLQAQYGDKSTVLQQTITNGQDPIKESLLISFKLAINEETASNAAAALFLTNSDGQSGGMYFGPLAYNADGGGKEYGFAIRQTPPGGGNSTYLRVGTDTMDINEWYTFNLEIDYNNMTLSGNVYDSNNTLATTFSGIEIWDLSNNLKDRGFNRVGVSIHQKGGYPYILVDDILISQIPEPTAAVLGFLGLGLLARRRRTSKG